MDAFDGVTTVVVGVLCAVPVGVISAYLSKYAGTAWISLLLLGPVSLGVGLLAVLAISQPGFLDWPPAWPLAAFIICISFGVIRAITMWLAGIEAYDYDNESTVSSIESSNGRTQPSKGMGGVLPRPKLPTLRVTCPRCGGSGVVRDGLGLQFGCGTCGGRGSITYG